ncbi:hypothetical protein CRN79_24585 [Serratia fonticola]|uniref:hypothetical protein n=1 Tax=Serratia fonticola TaxID=47917 RepID=UPI000BFCA343|nr:hypothetical protein [Serratia fonticola]ATM78810.1 hypothetical protein CRN79_24585 [Serratia fonticola]
MFEVKNATILFLEEGDFQNPDITIGDGALKDEVDRVALHADVMIYQNVMIKNRFGQAVKFPFSPPLAP